MARKDSLYWVAVILLVLGGASFLLYSPTSHAAPTVAWEPPSLYKSLATGESMTTSVSFVPLVNAQNLSVRVVPELAPYVSVSPSSFLSVTKGVPYLLTVTMSAPPDMAAGIYDGTIRILEGNRTLAAPLPVGLTITTSERPALVLKEVVVGFRILQDYGVPLEGVTVSTLLSEYKLTVDETVARIDFADAYKGQILFASNPDDNHFLIAYISADEIRAGTATVTVDSIAHGLIMLNPLMLGFGEKDRLAILAYSQAHPLYDDLTSEIKRALTLEPANLLQQAVFPKVYEYALTLVIQAIENVASSTLQRNFSSVEALAATPIVGSDQYPYLGDVPGQNIIVANPTMLFYGVDITGIKPQVISGKSSLWVLELGWPPVRLTDPVEELINLGDGTFDVTFTRGQRSAGRTAAGAMASTANNGRLFCDILDLLAWCPLSNDTIKKAAELETFPALASFANDVIDGSVQQLLNRSIDYLRNPDVWRELTRFVYSAAPDKQLAVKFLQAGKKVLGYANLALLASDIYDAADTTVPFIYDLLTKSSEDIKFCIQQQSGILTGKCQYIPPTAIAKRISPDSVYVGDVVTFDASQSFDDVTATDALSMRWDFYGDGSFTQWSTRKLEHWAYSNVGIYNVVLEVKDSDGLVGRDVLPVVVRVRNAGGAAKHIKAFRNVLPWSTLSFEKTMSVNGFTLGPGDNQYEILLSKELETVILVPGEDLVVIMNDQDQSFYNDLARYQSRLERFISNGGVVFWGACDRGWAAGSMAMAGIYELPGNVRYGEYYDWMNYNVHPTSSLMSELPYVLQGTYASHDEFFDTPPGAVTYTTNTRGLPTLMEYRLGNGSVMLTGQPLEYGAVYHSDWGLLYYRIFSYILGSDIENAPMMERSIIMPEVPSSHLGK